MNKKLKGLAALRQLQSPEENHQSQVDEKRNQEKAKPVESSSNRGKEFHNPYNFVPMMTRNKEWFEAEDEKLDFLLKQLGDRKPSSHGDYDLESWSGRLKIQLTTKTPLLIPDAAHATTGNSTGHQSFPLRTVDEYPYLSPTSLKGMIRSAYEAITNSRMGIFQGHTSRLAYRMKPTPKIQAGRIEENDTGGLVFQPLEAIKLLRYKKYQEDEIAPYDKGASQVATRYPSGELPQHGDAVWVQVEYSKNGVGRVEAIKKRELSVTSDQDGWKVGWVYVAGANCNEKKFERVFIEKRQPPIEITETEKLYWSGLVNDYKQQHTKALSKRQEQLDSFIEDQTKADEIFSRDLLKDYLDLHMEGNNACQAALLYLGHEPGQTAWSKHVYEEGSEILKKGTLCYAELEVYRKGKPKIISLIPVAISRQLFSNNPTSLVSKELKPATSLEQLSPADRVFGWINQSGNGSHKGQLCIHSVLCKSDSAVINLTSKGANKAGLALGILAQPKPTQTRFYTARDCQGNTLDNVAKKDGYQKQHGLRGRKVYPHHKRKLTYWSEERFSREYARPEQERDSQNRSIQAWVRPETEFEFQIDLTNLSDVELGALLWLLTLEPGHYHRLAGGKPYGFGSVSLTVNWEKSDFRQGKQWQNYYSSLKPTTRLEIKSLERQAEKLKKKFEVALTAAYGSNQQLLSSFTRMAQGFEDDLPIHYPRNQSKPSLDDENFKWFEENENNNKLALPILVEDHGLPIFSNGNSIDDKKKSTSTKSGGKPIKKGEVSKKPKLKKKS